MGLIPRFRLPNKVGNTTQTPDFVIVSSGGRCGIYEYSRMLVDAFAVLGQSVHHIAIAYRDHEALSRQLHQLKRNQRIVIFEYTPEIFDPARLLPQLVKLRWQKRHVILSIHDLNHGTIFRRSSVQRAMQTGLRPSSAFSFVTSAIRKLSNAIATRVALRLIGLTVNEVVVHSPRTAQQARSMLGRTSKHRYVPHFAQPLIGDPIESRKRRGLTSDVFAFIIPGFIVRAKRILEVIDALPAGVELWIVGTVRRADDFDSLTYLDEIRAKAASAPKDRCIRVIEDYENMEEYLIAADVAVLYYSHGSQSGIGSLSIGAGKPCIFSDISAFEHLRPAGLWVSTAQDLADAMQKIQEADTYSRLQAAAVGLNVALDPVNCVREYVKNSSALKGSPG